MSVLTSAADSDPIVTLLAPFLGRLMEMSMRSYSLLVTSRRLGGSAESENRFLNRTDLGVPRKVGSGRLV